MTRRPAGKRGGQAEVASDATSTVENEHFAASRGGTTDDVQISSTTQGISMVVSHIATELHELRREVGGRLSDLEAGFANFKTDVSTRLTAFEERIASKSFMILLALAVLGLFLTVGDPKGFWGATHSVIKLFESPPT